MTQAGGNQQRPGERAPARRAPSRGGIGNRASAPVGGVIAAAMRNSNPAHVRSAAEFRRLSSCVRSDR